jgi:hypothetical protein
VAAGSSEDASARLVKWVGDRMLDEGLRSDGSVVDARR